MHSYMETKDSNVYRLAQNDDVQFGFGLPPEVNEQLQRAAAIVTSREESLKALCHARTLAPDQLEVHIALYKFYFYQGETEKAEDVVYQTLSKAAQAGGFDHDLKSLSQDSTDWHDPRGPGRVFLYTLKALAFIRLRQDDPESAGEILDVLSRLDPTDKVGADVIRAILQGMRDDEDE